MLELMPCLEQELGPGTAQRAVSRALAQVASPGGSAALFSYS